MSSFYGIFYRDGRSVSQEEAQKMQQTFDWWRPDESDFVIQDNILIGQATLYNTPESKYEHLPLQKANYILAMDARIDNREELAKELELPNKPLQEIGDSEFILASYRKWGKACADKLLGDFAFVIWDEAKQELFCARDFIGVRPFYYYVDDEKFIFGSDLKALSQHPDIPLDIRDESIANYIVNRQLVDKKYTFFKSINKLEDGCYMYISQTSYKTTRYWHPNKVKKRKQPNEQAYIDELRNLLEDAVKVRLRTEYGVASHLSGGLDSSPLAVITSRELKKQNPNYRLPVFTWISAPSDKDDISHHEWDYILTIAKQEDMKLYWNTLSSKELLETFKEKNISTDGDTFPIFEISNLKKIAKLNTRLLISGWGGDEFLTNHSYAYFSEMFLKGKWNLIYNQLKNKPLKNILKVLYFRILVPNMPTRLYCFLPKIKCNSLDLSLYQLYLIPYIKKEYKKKTHIFARHTTNTVKKDIIRAWANGHIQSRLTSWNQLALEHHTQYVYPLLDKRLVEFSLSIPTQYLFKKYYDRYLYRQSIQDIIPHKVLWGKHKSETIRGEKNKILFEIFKKEVLKEKYINTYIKPLKYIEEVPNINSRDFIQNLLIEQL